MYARQLFFQLQSAAIASLSHDLKRRLATSKLDAKRHSLFHRPSKRRNNVIPTIRRYPEVLKAGSMGIAHTFVPSSYSVFWSARVQAELVRLQDRNSSRGFESVENDDEITI